MNTPLEENAVEIESPNEERSEVSAEVTPFRKPDSDQYTKSGEGTSPARARRGGGPRTSRGKERSGRNALTHGIFAKVALLGEESREQYDALVQGYRDYFHPVGTVEEVHVEELAILQWRYRRLLQAESAEIQSEKKFNSRVVEREQQQRGEAAILELSTTGRKYGLLEGRRNPLILGRVVELLELFKGSIEFRGFDPENDRAVINRVFGEQHECQILHIYGLYRDNSPLSGHPEFKEFDLPPAERQAKFLDCLRDEINCLKRSLKTLKRSSEEREGLESQSSFVPEPARLDRLLRYNASLQRDYDRCLNQLERLQRARKGQPALPTLNVNVSP